MSTADNELVTFWKFIVLYDYLIIWFPSLDSLQTCSCLRHVQISESAGTELWMSQSSREKGEGFPRGRTMSCLSGLSASAPSFSELAACPRTYQSLPAWLPELPSPRPLSICVKFIRLHSVCVAIMAAPSCRCSKRAYGLQRPCTDAAEACECSQLLTLADCSRGEKTSPPSFKA